MKKNVRRKKTFGVTEGKGRGASFTSTPPGAHLREDRPGPTGSRVVRTHLSCVRKVLETVLEERTPNKHSSVCRVF